MERSIQGRLGCMRTGLRTVDRSLGRIGPVSLIQSRIRSTQARPRCTQPDQSTVGRCRLDNSIAKGIQFHPRSNPNRQTYRRIVRLRADRSLGCMRPERWLPGNSHSTHNRHQHRKTGWKEAGRSLGCMPSENLSPILERDSRGRSLGTTVGQWMTDRFQRGRRSENWSLIPQQSTRHLHSCRQLDLMIRSPDCTCPLSMRSGLLQQTSRHSGRGRHHSKSSGR